MVKYDRGDIDKAICCRNNGDVFSQNLEFREGKGRYSLKRTLLAKQRKLRVTGNIDFAAVRNGIYTIVTTTIPFNTQSANPHRDTLARFSPNYREIRLDYRSQREDEVLKQQPTQRAAKCSKTVVEDPEKRRNEPNAPRRTA
ncbi:hypothetical protein KIN20_014736 [Parelaphostrongylus tenuis]|uniref:Uncharacterized protein n=1 Tax=Parelaphostrongylus tenuis TaxID=148309 RepID=A0AAD5MWJ7_PARTN|nr:hypothetical protein KIN20_014736 [Parelaphostrongylus tenuis]